jgi:gliding motility-associated-like protein
VINAPGQTGGEQLTAPAGTGYTYFWNTNETSPSIFVIYSGNYSVDVTNTLGCTTQFTIVVKQRTLIIPNIFSPNGDNINDKWVIQHLENYPGSVVQIYNRYGQVVHRIVNTTPWDGRLNGKDMPVGTYYYVIDLKNGQKPVTGYIDIIR